MRPFFPICKLRREVAQIFRLACLVERARDHTQPFASGSRRSAPLRHLIRPTAANSDFRFLKWLSRSPMARCADAGKSSGAHFNSFRCAIQKLKIMARDSRRAASAHELHPPILTHLRAAPHQDDPICAVLFTCVPPQGCKSPPSISIARNIPLRCTSLRTPICANSSAVP